VLLLVGGDVTVRHVEADPGKAWTDLKTHILETHTIEILVLHRRLVLKKGKFVSAGLQPILCCKGRFFESCKNVPL
jgi:hypothetical protein